MRSQGQALMPEDWSSYKRGWGHRQAQRDNHGRTQGEHGVHSPREGHNLTTYFRGAHKTAHCFPCNGDPISPYFHPDSLSANMKAFMKSFEGLPSPFSSSQHRLWSGICLFLFEMLLHLPWTSAIQTSCFELAFLPLRVASGFFSCLLFWGFVWSLIFFFFCKIMAESRAALRFYIERSHECFTLLSPSY